MLSRRAGLSATAGLPCLKALSESDNWHAYVQSLDSLSDIFLFSVSLKFETMKALHSVQHFST